MSAAATVKREVFYECSSPSSLGREFETLQEMRAYKREKNSKYDYAKYKGQRVIVTTIVTTEIEPCK